MATKPKTTETSAPVKDQTLEARFSQALDAYNAGSLQEAQAAFTAVMEEAGRAEAYRLGHSAQAYLKAIQTRLETLQGPLSPSQELSATVELNEAEPEAALARVDEALTARPDHAGLNYLKAVALAQLGEAQACADALAKALALDPGLIYQFRLEADFDGIRHTAPFAVFNRG